MEKDLSRKKFIGWAVGLSTLMAATPFVLRLPFKKVKKTSTVKMLTQDGKLVEIDVANIPAKKRKLGVADIHGWIRRKTFM